MLVLFIALALSGLLYGQLPSTTNFQPVTSGFATEFPQTFSGIRTITSAGDSDVVLYNTTTPTPQTIFSVLKNRKVVYEVKDGDPLLGGSVLNSTNQPFNVLTSIDKKTITFGAWCEPRIDKLPNGSTVTIYQMCRVIMLDTTSWKATLALTKGQTLTMTRDAFGGLSRREVTITSIRGVPVSNGNKMYGVLELKSLAGVTYPGLYEINPVTREVVGLVSDTSPQHNFVFSLVAVSTGKVVYNNSTGNLGGSQSSVRLYDLTTRAWENLIASNTPVDGMIFPGTLYPRIDVSNQEIYLTANNNTAVRVFPGKPDVLLSSTVRFADKTTATTTYGYFGNGLGAVPYRTQSAKNVWEHDGVAIGKDGSFQTLIKAGDVVGGSPISKVGGDIAPHRCSVTVPIVDQSTGRYGKILDVRPVFVRTLVASSDGKTARVSGCVNIEGTTLDSLSIGGATAEVVRRGVDPDGYDYIEVRPLAPIYGGANEVAVVVNGRRFASTISVEGSVRPKIEVAVVNSASFEPNLSPGAIATLFSKDTDLGVLFNTSLKACGVETSVFGNTGAQLSFVIPREAPILCEIVLFKNNREIAKTQLQLRDLSPAIYTYENGTLPIATHEDYSLIGPESKTTEGKLVTLWGTGFGPLEEINGNKVCTTSLVYKIGDTKAEMIYCGASGAGYQITLRVPWGTQAGKNPLWIERPDGETISPEYVLWVASTSDLN